MEIVVNQIPFATRLYLSAIADHVADWNRRIARGIGHGADKAPAGGRRSGLGPIRARVVAGSLGGHVNDWGSDEHELVRRCRAGSEAAYAELVRQHRPRLYTLAYRLIGDRETAEDVVQEAFLAAFKAIDRFEPKPALAPWLNTIAVRIAKRAAGRRRARPSASLDRMATDRLAIDDDAPLALADFAIVDPAGDPHVAAETAELRRELAAAIEGLPFTYRAAVVLRYVIGLDYAEAAQSLDVPLNTFKSQLLRGTRLLRDQLAGRLDVPGRPIVIGRRPQDAQGGTREPRGAVDPVGNGQGSGAPGADPELEVATDPELKVATDPELKVATDPELLATHPRTTDPPARLEPSAITRDPMPHG